MIDRPSLGGRVFPGRPPMEDIEDVVHSSLVEIEGLQDDRVYGVIFWVCHQ